MTTSGPNHISDLTAQCTEIEAGKKSAKIKCIDLAKLHTTPLGDVRVRHNIGLCPGTDVVAWARRAVEMADAKDICRRGKNFYICAGDFILTINANSNTLITVHKKS